jgi:hypothetical protein
VSTNSKRPAIEIICMRNNPVSRVMQTDEPTQFGVSFFRTRQNLGRRYGAIRGRKVDLGASIPANYAKRSRGQDVVGGLTGKPVMLEKSAIPQTTTAGPVPSPAMGYPETTVRDFRGRKALNGSFAEDQVHGSAGGSRRG